MKILVTGGKGQLGRAVARRGAALGHVIAAPDIDELDISDEQQVHRALRDFAPAIVINAAAYTAVDKAESERGRAYAINRDGAGTVARVCAAARTRLLHVSTDYVFDGTATRPYREDDPLAPLGVYGESKAEGEHAVHEIGGTIVRTSWLFEGKGPSFVHAILRLAKERSVLRVVADQRGCPTWADDLADALFVLAERRTLDAVYHFCNAGETTWHAFAVAIVDEARKYRTLACERIDPITTAEYPTAAKRPAYSVLDTSRIRALGIEPPSWQSGLAAVVEQELS
ncbi:MAG TPA: dTDP-4-dehydrorhamnose reductase [Kofleriaceae bacterium]|nr:dTDP-4-dehydrorhamnose reductase [Kofleriaceae bacterium]